MARWRGNDSQFWMKLLFPTLSHEGQLEKYESWLGILRLDLCQAVADGLFAWPS